jgi:hypothetical protein
MTKGVTVMKRYAVYMLVAFAALLATRQLTFAEDAISSPAQKAIGTSKTEMVPSLAALNSRSATLQGNKLTLTGVSANSIIFADRPVRAAGHVLTSEFIKQWDVGNDSFAKDPPNATISVLGNDGASVKDAVVVLKTAKLEGDQLTFDVSVLEGDLANATGPTSLFIDWFAARGGFGHVGVVGGVGFHAPVWHGAYYARPGAAFAGGAAVGAVGAAAAIPRAATIPTHLVTRENQDATFKGYAVGDPYGSLRRANAGPR